MYYNMIVKTLYGLLIKICKSVNIQINKNIQELEVRIKTPYFPGGRIQNQDEQEGQRQPVASR